MNKLTTLGEEVSGGAGSDPEDEDDIDSQQSDCDSGVFNRQFPSSHNAYPSKKQVKCVLRTTGLQVYEEYFSLIKFCSGCLLTKASFWSSKSILSKCNERGHINWGHTLFSKISIIFIVVKPSHSLYNYSNIEILYKKVRDGVGEGGGRVGVDGRVGHGGLDVFMYQSSTIFAQLFLNV